MWQHDLSCRCQNRGLVLPRLGGADEAFLRVGRDERMEARWWMGVWVASMKLASILFLTCVWIYQRDQVALAERGSSRPGGLTEAHGPPPFSPRP